jgi:[acyl-carrier-protein] S-malonyltransferase
MLALLCGGQGLVSASMFDLVTEEPRAQPVFANATSLLGMDPRAIVRDKPVHEISHNRTSQILSVTAALAHFTALEPGLPDLFAVTGYSVGEMAAWSIAGIWPPAEALRLTEKRACAMDQASEAPGRLAYVRGLGEAHVARLADAHGCQIAIINPGDLIVVGGLEDAMPAFCEQARNEGAARAELLAVHVAAHTKLLKAAVPAFETELRESDFREPHPGRLILSGGNGERIFKVEANLDRLAAQIAEPINWVSTLDSLGERGVDRILDLGPGTALQRAASTYLKGIPCYAVNDFRSVSGLTKWLDSYTF